MLGSSLAYGPVKEGDWCVLVAEATQGQWLSFAKQYLYCFMIFKYICVMNTDLNYLCKIKHTQQVTSTGISSTGMS
jgi:hypothetical protein